MFIGISRLLFMLTNSYILLLLHSTLDPVDLGLFQENIRSD